MQIQTFGEYYFPKKGQPITMKCPYSEHHDTHRCFYGTTHTSFDMKKIGIFYGSTTGTTENVAHMIAKCLGVEQSDVHNTASTPPSATAGYDVLILGASTWEAGDLQDDMDTFLDGLQVIDLSGKMVAIFGCGDDSMSDTYCNSVGEIYHRLHDTHAEFFAPFNNDGYTYNNSESDIKGMTVGLCIDNVNHPEDTEVRIKEWCADIKQEIC